MKKVFPVFRELSEVASTGSMEVGLGAIRALKRPSQHPTAYVDVLSRLKNDCAMVLPAD